MKLKWLYLEVSIWHFKIFCDVFLSEFWVIRIVRKFDTISMSILWWYEIVDFERGVFWMIILIKMIEWCVLLIGSDCCVLGRCGNGIWDIAGLRWSELFGIVYRLNLLCDCFTSRGLRKLLDFARDIVIWSR